MSYREIHRRVVAARRLRGVSELPVYNTVYRCLQPKRSRLDVELVVDIAAALLDDESLVAAWRQAHQVVVGRAADAAIVAVADSIPAAEENFVGRGDLVAGLVQACNEQGGQFVLSGMAGVGKTQLAHQAAHQLLAAGRGTDLQLAVDLRGFDQDRPPADPAAVLDGFLRRLGVPGNQVHCLDLAGRVRRFRQLMEGRDAIVVLDNAATEDQVRPLLPLNPAGVTLVTSRYRLSGLPDVRSVTLDVFSPEQSLELLHQIAGDKVISADLGTAARLVQLLGHLPLALAVLAGRIVNSPGWSLRDHLERLTEHRDRLRLDDGVELALALSYETLPPGQRELLRLLALHPGRDLDPYTAAAVAGRTRAAVTEDLADLIKASLVQPGAPGRYLLHDLVRVFAANRSRDEDRGCMRRDALSRLFGYYRWTAAQASGLYAPHEGGHWTTVVEDPGQESPRFTHRDDARAWLDAERANLVAVVRAAAAAGERDPVLDISAVTHYYLDTAGYYREAELIHECATSVAIDDAALSRAWNNLGCIHWRLGRYADGRDCYQRALELTHGLNNPLATGKALSNVALGHFRLGHYQEAIDCYQQALPLLDEEPVGSSASTARGGFGWSLLRAGRCKEALATFEQALQIARKLAENTCEESYALCNIATAHEHLGDLEQAAEYGEAALRLAGELSFKLVESDASNLLGRIRRANGDPAGAVGLHQRALDLTLETGNRSFGLEIHNDLGTSLLAAGRVEEAQEHHRLALQLAQTLEDRYELARANAGLAAALDEGGEPGAGLCRRRALELFAQLGTSGVVPPATGHPDQQSAPLSAW